MKAIHKLSLSLLVLGMVLISASSLSAQTPSSNQTVSFKVYGVCGDCKQRIESTAMDVKGVKKAEWDVQSDMLVCVGTSKMDKLKIATALSKAGHRSELMNADAKAYAKLPECCQYDSGAHKH